ncbi:MAG TPA: hypothetical protein VNI57_10645, partial [Candidatus Saccharimonadales bacterium]|nr:hypothetical protein [Candidatus Saccharimonadales bacterium]
MSEESRSGGREFQLETRHLAAIIVLIALLCITSFMLGRWVERQAMHDTAAGVIGKADPDDLTVEDVNRELTYFHTLDGGEKPPDVRRPEPVQPEAPADVETAAAGKAATDASKPAPSAAPEGNLMIQVMATKDLSSAIAMRQKL